MVDLKPENVKIQMGSIFSGHAKQGVIPPLWDGQAAARIAERLFELYE